jgi:hypothetical protein
MSNKRQSEKKMVGLWLDQELKSELQRTAESQNRSLSNMIETILKTWADEHAASGRISEKIVSPRDA